MHHVGSNLLECGVVKNAKRSYPALAKAFSRETAIYSLASLTQVTCLQFPFVQQKLSNTQHTCKDLVLPMASHEETWGVASHGDWQVARSIVALSRNPICTTPPSYFEV